MKKFLIAIALILSPNILFAFVIQHFESDLEVQPNGKINVVETITVDFSSTPNKHGIFRNIPYESKTENGGTNVTPIENFKVTDEQNVRRNFTKTSSSKNHVLKIGSGNKYVRSTEIYKISYTIDGVVKNFDGENFDQIYWNATGDQWDTKILKSTTRIKLPKNSTIQKTKCFVGRYGSKNQDCQSASQKNLAFFSTEKTLYPDEGFTILYGFDQGIAESNKNFENTKASWKEKLANFLGISAETLTLLGGILPFLAGILGIAKAKRETDALKPQKAIVPKYEVPENLHPVLVGTVVDGNFDPRDFTAGVLELAVKKCITIKSKTVDSFFGDKTKISLVKTKNTSANIFDNELLTSIFGNAKTVVPAQSRVKMRATFLKLSFQAKQNDFFSTKNETSTPFWKKIFNWQSILSGIIALIFFWPAAVGALIFTLIGVGIVGQNRSKKGYAMAYELECFKEFLKTAELDQLNWASKQEIFEKNLPYAAAFGLEKKWTKIFGDSIIVPTWLPGGNINTLHKNLDQISQDFAASIQPPKSSGNSGFSSSGGFSGGGSGGGGGSSW